MMKKHDIVYPNVDILLSYCPSRIVFINKYLAWNFCYS